jgi:GDPmannose 4,6-dehydratase
VPIALITGITGQDGSYLTELLLEKGYTVHGLVRRSSSTVRQRIDHLTVDESIYNKRLFLHYADLDDTTTVRRILTRIRPDEIYHLAGQSHVGHSFDIPESTCEFAAMGTLRLLEIIRDLNPRPKLLHASSSEIFGQPNLSPQDETTPMNPVTPYGVAKAFATQMVRVYRQAHGFFACNAICYNHESPRRGESFVTRKITRGVARIKLGLQKTITLGNIDSSRDWGFAKDYVEAMWRMLQQSQADDYVLATGRSRSVRDFLKTAFEFTGLQYENHTSLSPHLIRPLEVTSLVGNPTKAQITLDWKSTTQFEDLVQLMVLHDIEQQSNNPKTEV